MTEDRVETPEEEGTEGTSLSDLEDSSISQDSSEETAETDSSSVIKELNDKYLRCYAEFENYKKRMIKEKEELLKYGNESLLYELLPAIDNLELAIKHAEADSNSGIVQGVEMTLKEVLRTLEKFGLTRIDSCGKAFDPSVHHAMMNVEREDIDEKMVAEELRSGYMLRDKVLRPALVAVSVKHQEKINAYETVGIDSQDDNSEAEGDSDNSEININEDMEE